jgi:sucrose phosphorylase
VNERQSNAFRYIGTPERPEADMAYQFTHFPLAVHAVLRKSGFYYSAWLRTVSQLAGRQFTTVLGSHDGLGMKPLRGMLPPSEIDFLSSTLAYTHGGLPNYAVLPGGRKIIYEICATPWCLINNPESEEPFALQLKRYLAVTSLGLGIPGIPALYLNGVLGSKNYCPPDGLDENRTANRERFDLAALHDVLNDSAGEQAIVFQSICQLLERRRAYSQFSPHATLAVMDTECDACIAFALQHPTCPEHLVQLVNVSDEQQEILLYLGAEAGTLRSVDEDKEFAMLMHDTVTMRLEPFEVCWFLLTPA